MLGFLKYFLMSSVFAVILYVVFIPKLNSVLFYEGISDSVICGNDICESFYNSEINVDRNVLQWIVNLFSKKTFSRATYRNERVVLKSLGSREQFKKVEMLFNLTFNDLKREYTSHEYVSFIKSKILEIVMPTYNKSLPKLTFCSFMDGIDTLLKKLPTYKELSLNDFFYIWTSFQINPEPFLLQIMQPPTWPTPKYYGVCEHVLVVEDCGTPLINYYNAPWLDRANYSLQLIENALKLTFLDLDFVFYMTDISPDNIVINSEGIVKFIDLENVILIHRKNTNLGNYFHTTIHNDCSDCFIFDPEGICNNPISDHNIYAVCKEILSDSSLLPNGFLHSYPSEVDTLEAVIEECVSPRVKDRFQIASEIASFLRILLNSE